MHGSRALHATKTDQAHLQESIDRMSVLTDRPTEFAMEAVRFHMLLSAASQNSILTAITTALREFFHADYVGLQYNQHDLTAAVSAHQRVLDEIVGNRPEEAQEALARHLGAFADATSRVRHRA